MIQPYYRMAKDEVKSLERQLDEMREEQQTSARERECKDCIFGCGKRHSPNECGYWKLVEPALVAFRLLYTKGSSPLGSDTTSTTADR